MWFVKNLKKLVSEHVATVNMLKSLKTWTKAIPSYCLITLANIELENDDFKISETLGLFVNTLTADEQYYLQNRKNLQEPIQLQLSKKQKSFSQLLPAYMKSISNVRQFKKKDDLQRLCLIEIRDCKRRG